MSPPKGVSTPQKASGSDVVTDQEDGKNHIPPKGTKDDLYCIIRDLAKAKLRPGKKKLKKMMRASLSQQRTRTKSQARLTSRR